MIISFPLKLKSQTQAGCFIGYASVFEVIDCQNEQILPGAFQKTLQQWRKRQQLPKMLWQHDPKQPIGLWRQVKEDTYGLRVEGQLLLELAKGREAYSLLKQGVIDGLSIGFTTIKSRKSYLAKVRVLEEVELHEISLVTFAANPAAKVLECKAFYQGQDNLLYKINTLTVLLSSPP